MNPDDAQHCAVPASAAAVIACVGFTGTTLSLISIGAIFPTVNSIGGIRQKYPGLQRGIAGGGGR